MRIIAIVLIACQLSACTSWRVETLSPADVINQRAPDVPRLSSFCHSFNRFSASSGVS